MNEIDWICTIIRDFVLSDYTHADVIIQMTVSICAFWFNNTFEFICDNLLHPDYRFIVQTRVLYNLYIRHIHNTANTVTSLTDVYVQHRRNK